MFALACRVADDGDRDGIPNVLVEAMAARRPGGVHRGVRASPSSSRDGENGLLVPPDDPAALADALARVGQRPRAARRASPRPGGARCRATSTATRSPAGWRALFAAAADDGLTAADARGRCRGRARSSASIDAPAPRPRRRPRRARRAASRTTAVTLDLGRRPDWLRGGLDDDEEWRIEWVKLYEGLDLAHALRRSPATTPTCGVGGPRRRRSATRSRSATTPSDVSRPADAELALRLAGFAEAPAGTACVPGWRDGCASACRADADHLRRPPHARSATTARWSSTRCCCVGARPRRRRARARGRPGRSWPTTPRTDVWPDGVHRECSQRLPPHRAALASSARSPTPAGRARRPAGCWTTAPRRACDFALHVQRPDG